MSSTTAAPTNTIKGFFQMRHNFGRYPFNPTGTPVKTTNKSTAAPTNTIKGFFQTRQKFGRQPFATQV
jgi:hypothetical protein